MNNTAHDNDATSPWREPEFWRDPQRLTKEGYTGRSYFNCSRCGGMRPDEVLAKLREGGTIHAADRKYGWPHKFYIQFVNPRCGDRVKLGSICVSHEPGPELLSQYEEWVQDGSRWKGTHYGPAPATEQGKFYSVHLIDCDSGLFQEISNLVFEKTGVRFGKDAYGRLIWSYY